MDGNNLWKIERFNGQNCPDYSSGKIVEGTWMEVCNKYNPTYSDDIRIVPLQNYKEDFSKTLSYYSGIKPEKANNILRKDSVVKKTLEAIGEYYGDVIGVINDKIREAASNGENRVMLFDVELEEPDRLEYYYTKLDYNFAYTNGNLRLIW